MLLRRLGGKPQPLLGLWGATARKQAHARELILLLPNESSLAGAPGWG